LIIVFCTWGVMAMASLAMGWLVCLLTTPSWAGWFLAPLLILGGPFALLLGFHAAPTVGVCVVLYSMGVGWLFWKPSGWSTAVFILLSLLRWLFGCMIVSAAV
jgi:hypothetical protein